MNKMLAISLVVAGIGIGCAAGTVAVNLMVPEARAETSPSRWEYMCEKTPRSFTGTPVEAIVDFWNKAGAAGWRKYDSYGGYTCFIREYGGSSSTAQLIQSSQAPAPTE